MNNLKGQFLVFSITISFLKEIHSNWLMNNENYYVIESNYSHSDMFVLCI